MRAIRLLTLWKLKNSLRTAFTDPRKLIPLIIIAFFLGIAVFIQVMVGTDRPASSPKAGAVDPAIIQIGVYLGLVFLALGILDYGLGDNLLAFGQSDVDYLFPSPISRRSVLAYRLPGLLLGGLFHAGLMMFVFSMVTTALTIDPKAMGRVESPSWLAPLALLLCISAYLNLALFAAVSFARRRTFRILVLGACAVIAAGAAYAAWKNGLPGVLAYAQSPLLRGLFWPSALAADTLVATAFHRPAGGAIPWLAGIWSVSLVPMFMSNANWYEQSIASSDKIAAYREAAKGGWAGLMAANASKHRHRGSRAYTFPPFGQGPGALVWAHLCAAGKRAWPNFYAPAVVGLVVGFVMTLVPFPDASGRYVVFVLTALYSGMLFMGAAKTASEASIRRRDLMAPLPIRGWSRVAADLAVPFSSLYLFSVTAALPYVVSGFAYWPFVGFGFFVLFPLRLASRMVFQYILVLGHPDLADKIQQLVSQFAFWLFAPLFVIAEAIFLVPAILLRSIWLGLITVTIFEAGLLWLMLRLAGRAVERAIASGEPVRIRSLLRP